LGGCCGEGLVVAFYVGEVQGIEVRVQAFKVTRRRDVLVIDSEIGRGDIVGAGNVRYFV
jgi:hypothetical protein